MTYHDLVYSPKPVSQLRHCLCLFAPSCILVSNMLSADVHARDRFMGRDFACHPNAVLQARHAVTLKVACWLHVGAQLVPVLAFGENDVWHARQVKEGKLHEIQEAVKR